jgi:peroxiredoxin
MKGNTPKKSQPPSGAPPWLWGLLAVALAGTAILFLLPQEGRIKQGSPLDPNLGVTEPRLVSSLHLREQANHPVTKEMKETADGMVSGKAPNFSLPGTDGQVHTLASLTKDKPLLIFFVEKECPCCLGAKHFVDKLVDLYPKELNAVGIINADDRVAKAWEKVTKPRFLVLQDPAQEVIRAYKAERGVYTTLVSPDGSIEAAYPGYSLDSLNDMSRRIAKLAKTNYRRVISAAAPKEMTSGCLFPEPPADQAKQ